LHPFAPKIAQRLEAVGLAACQPDEYDVLSKRLRKPPTGVNSLAVAVKPDLYHHLRMIGTAASAGIVHYKVIHWYLFNYFMDDAAQVSGWYHLRYAKRKVNLQILVIRTEGYLAIVLYICLDGSMFLVVDLLSQN
jgi:hypothetical protein